MDHRFISSVFLNTWRELSNWCSVGAEFAEETDSEDEDAIGVFMMSKINETPHRIEDYIEITVANYTEKEFQSHFRLQLCAYEQLEAMLGPQLSRRMDQNYGIDVRRQILSVLWLLATPDSYRSVGDRFNLAKSSLNKCFINVVQELNKIAPKVINWPNNQEKLEAEEVFASFGGLRGCIGAVDGAFIEIKAPKEDPHVYTCRKNFYACQLQVIALPNLKIIDAFTGYPGSVGDRRVFVNSPIYKNIEQNKGTYFAGDEYILGDKAYPVLPWCIPPFINRGNMTERQTNFNTRHAKTRQVVERTFALLFGRYRRLKYLDMNKTKLIAPTILACCVLHNICLINETETLEELITDGEAFLRAQRNRMGPENENAPPDNTNDGHRRRELLVRNFC